MKRDPADQDLGAWRWDDLAIAAGLVAFLAACAAGWI